MPKSKHTSPKQTASVTDKRVDLDEDTIAALDLKLRILADMVAEHPKITVTYFHPDDKKEGGAYVTAIGAVKKIDDYEGNIVLVDGKRIPIDDILDIECELYSGLTNGFGIV